VTTSAFAHRNLLGIEPLSRADILQVLDLLEGMLAISNRPIKKVPTLRGRTVLNWFLENSTRTRVSFEIAAKRMSADAINISGAGSSISKGESILDTAKNLMAMQPDVIVVRHSAAGTPALLAKHVDAAVVNAGDGVHEHPTQALLDALTIRRAKGRIEGLTVVIVGDINQRVARSNILCLTRLGAHVRLCGPCSMIPREIMDIGGEETRNRLSVFHRLDEAVEGADVVMMLRIQNERGRIGAPRFSNTREYSRHFGLSLAALERASADAIVMHPGPVNRGVEMMPEVQEGARSVILHQVTHGVAVRMAVLYLLGGGHHEESSQ